jgi:DNA ligase (NAD+)
VKNFLDYASQKYYEGNPIIEDAEFDALAEKYEYKYVGAPVKDGVAHMYPLYSLKKYYEGEGEVPFVSKDTIKTPKLDGAAVSLLYIGGELKLALTRGDGKRGLDITDKMKCIVPNFIDYIQILQINGEVVAPKEYENARNYAAGALNLKSVIEFQRRELQFVAYGIEPNYLGTYIRSMEMLLELGFTNVYHNAESLLKRYPTDGFVFRLNDNKAFEEAGYTSSHPRGAYALKVRQKGVRTRLLNVDWQVGRSGVVSPVAILEPVMVGDAKVSRATLHNMKYIEELGLEIGCDVEIVRAGEIIPRVVRRV